MFFSNLKIPFGFLVRTGAGSGGNGRWIWWKQALDLVETGAGCDGNGQGCVRKVPDSGPGKKK